MTGHNSIQDACIALIAQSEYLQERCVLLRVQLQADTEVRKVIYERNRVVKQCAEVLVARMHGHSS